MHKLRNTLHIAILNSMLNVIPPGGSKPISKKKMRQFLQYRKWDKTRVLKEIEEDTYCYCWPFCKE